MGIDFLYLRWSEADRAFMDTSEGYCRLRAFVLGALSENCMFHVSHVAAAAGAHAFWETLPDLAIGGIFIGDTPAGGRSIGTLVPRVDTFIDEREFGYRCSLLTSEDETAAAALQIAPPVNFNCSVLWNPRNGGLELLPHTHGHEAKPFGEMLFNWRASEAVIRSTALANLRLRRPDLALLADTPFVLVDDAMSVDARVALAQRRAQQGEKGTLCFAGSSEADRAATAEALIEFPHQVALGKLEWSDWTLLTFLAEQVVVSVNPSFGTLAKIDLADIIGRPVLLEGDGEVTLSALYLPPGCPRTKEWGKMQRDGLPKRSLGAAISPVIARLRELAGVC